MSRFETIPLAEIMATRLGTVEPMNFPNEQFDYYSIPAFDTGAPALAFGKEIGSAKQILQTHDVVLSRIVPHIRRAWVIEENRGRRIIGSGEWIVFRSDRFHPAYLRHLLVSDSFHPEFMRTVSGVGGSLLRARPTNVARIGIPLPPMGEQRRIAAILDRAEALRAKRRAALAKLDTLTQSLFLEMFGDPSSNPRAWPSVSLGDLIYSASDGPHVSPTYSDQGTPFLSTRNIRAGQIIWEDLKFISDGDAHVQWRKCKPEKGDILYTKGGTTGFAVTVDFERPIAVWVHVALLKPDHSKVDHYWLETMLNTSFCYAQSQRYTHGIANRDLGLSRMKKIRLYQPPLERQREFSSTLLKLRTVREIARQAQTYEDTLFHSLQHRAFRGDL